VLTEQYAGINKILSYSKHNPKTP